MRLKEKYYIEPSYKVSGTQVEKWELDGDYEIIVFFSDTGDDCEIGISGPDSDLTYELAPYLNVDTDPNKLTKIFNRTEELYVITGIDCAVLVYKNKENYMELLKKIEKIVNADFKKT